MLLDVETRAHRGVDGRWSSPVLPHVVELDVNRQQVVSTLHEVCDVALYILLPWRLLVGRQRLGLECRFAVDPRSRSVLPRDVEVRKTHGRVEMKT